MKVRLRDAPASYDGTRDNFVSGNHAMRTLICGSMIATIAPMTILDPACGDASIVEAAHRQRPIEYALLGDISKRQIKSIAPTFSHRAEVADLLELMDRPGRFDLVVLTEILEHIEDPVMALRLARMRADFLLASSPVGDPEERANHEHVWAWDEAGYELMLRDEGWDPRAKLLLTFPGTPWNNQIWLAR